MVWYVRWSCSKGQWTHYCQEIRGMLLSPQLQCSSAQDTPISDMNILQRVATSDAVEVSLEFHWSFRCKFTAECADERSIKIDKYLQNISFSLFKK